MDRRTLALVAIVVAAALVGGVGAVAPVAAEPCSFPTTATDDTGTEVTVESPPSRIVVLGASAAQTLWEVGARGKVVGMPVQPYTTYLDGAENRTPVMNEGGFTVDVETVVDLEPDLVLAPNIIPVETVTRLREAGLTVFRFETARSIEDVYAKTTLTGRLTGHCSGAERSVAEMQSRVAVVREAVSGKERPRVLLPLGGGFVAGGGTFLDEMVTVAGGRNVAAEANVTGFQQVSPEVVVQRDPQWLVVPSTLPRSEYASPAFNATTAVQQDQIIVVDANLANQPAPRLVVPLETIAKALHPEAYAAANESATTASPTPTATTVAPTETPAPTESPGQHGFGLVVAMAALVALVVVGRARR